MNDVIVSNIPIALVPPWPVYRVPSLYQCKNCGIQQVYEKVTGPYICLRCMGMMLPVEEPNWVTTMGSHVRPASKNHCLKCGDPLLAVVCLTAEMGGPQICGKCIDVLKKGVVNVNPRKKHEEIEIDHERQF